MAASQPLVVNQQQSQPLLSPSPQPVQQQQVQQQQVSQPPTDRTGQVIQDPRSASQLDAAAANRAATVDLNPPTENAPNPNGQQLPELQNENAFDEDAAALLQADRERAESQSKNLQIVQGFVMFAFGMLLIISIGAIVFYVLDFAMSLFEFDLSEYTQWVILFLAFLNLIFSCCGCWGTYKFSEIDKENNRKLDAVTEELGRSVAGLQVDNDNLAEALRRFEVEITHIEGENKELKASLLKFQDQEQDLIEVRRGNARLFVSLRELWNLFKIYETNDMICRITKITAAYYKRAYQDNDDEPGLTEEQYDDLIRSSVIPVNEKAYFPTFNSSVWDRNGRLGKTKDGPILVDELERVCVLIYKRVLQQELEIQLNEEETRGQQKSLDLTRAILDDGQDEESDPGFFQSIANVFG